MRGTVWQRSEEMDAVQGRVLLAAVSALSDPHPWAVTAPPDPWLGLALLFPTSDHCPCSARSFLHHTVTRELKKQPPLLQIMHARHLAPVRVARAPSLSNTSLLDCVGPETPLLGRPGARPSTVISMSLEAVITLVQRNDAAWAGFAGTPMIRRRVCRLEL